MFSNILGGAAGFPVADLGDGISQSLRFRGGNQTMQRTFSSTFNASGTLSAWIKLGSSDDAYFFGGNVSGHYEIIGQTSQQFYGVDRFGSNKLANGKQRDYSGWYHICVNFNSGDWWINGQQQTTDLALTNHSNMNNWNIGYSIQGSKPFEGYMAEVIFVDGSDIAETNFGRYQEDGVWVPRNYTGTYGTNGFRLDFADSSDLGNDVSGNNNDFTATNFETTTVARYTGNEAGSTSTYQSNSANRTQSLSNEGSTFDGATAGGTQVSGGGGGYWYLENKSFSNLTGLRLLWGDVSQVADIRLNGTSVSFTTSGSYTVVDTDDIPTTVTEIAARRDRDNTQVLQVEINTGSGFTALLDNRDNDVDIPDSPTTLYPTYNAPACHSSQTLSNANLAASAASYTFAPATISIPADCGKKFYWEVTVTNVSGNPTIGMTDPTQRVGQASAYNWVWAPTLEDIESPQGNISNLVDTSVSTINTAAGTTYMFAYDADTQNVWIGDSGNWYQRDGASGVGNPSAGTNPFLTTSDNCIIDGNTYAPCTAGSSVNTTAYEINFGQFDFQYTAPTDFVDLNSENFPEPAIKNGKDHFDVVTYQGTGASHTRTDLAFQPDLVWFKITSHSDSHALYDSVRGAQERLQTDSVGVQAAQSQALTAFNSDGWTMGTDSQINFNGRDYVAWCWKGGGTAVSNTDGSTTSSVSANTTAGFSIVKYTGTSANATVGHGLNSAPEFIIFKDYTDSNEENWNIYHSALDASDGDRLVFNNAGIDEYGSTLYNSTAPTSSVIHLGNNVDINDNGEDVIAYCWHSVEGYSRIGTYIGNGSNDGAFVYLGFRPHWLMFKGLASSCNWEIQDSTRCTENPMLNVLYPNRSDSQTGNDTANAVDFLANGFKLRNNASNHNQNGREFIYIAFAENPFVGENVPPATAR